ncbi:MAG: hypothetical protein WC631_01925 [Candidatus Paceibacterota bacterium]|jgi:hypothetical protein
MEKFNSRQQERASENLDDVPMNERREVLLKLIEYGLGTIHIKDLNKLPERDRLEVAQAIIEHNYSDLDIVMTVLTKEEKEILQDKLIDSGLKKSRK